jgi:hypothetical protein
VPLPDCDLVVILDVLHYVDHAAQAALLARVRRRWHPQGRLLLRVGDTDAVARLCRQPVGRPRGHPGARPPRATHLRPVASAVDGPA